MREMKEFPIKDSPSHQHSPCPYTQIMPRSTGIASSKKYTLSALHFIAARTS